MTTTTVSVLVSAIRNGLKASDLYSFREVGFALKREFKDNAAAWKGVTIRQAIREAARQANEALPDGREKRESTEFDRKLILAYAIEGEDRKYVEPFAILGVRFMDHLDS